VSSLPRALLSISVGRAARCPLHLSPRRGGSMAGVPLHRSPLQSAAWRGSWHAASAASAAWRPVLTSPPSPGHSPLPTRDPPRCGPRQRARALRGVARPLAAVELPLPCAAPAPSPMAMEFLREEEEKKEEDGSSVNYYVRFKV
jgi:hypothetical protein